MNIHYLADMDKIEIKERLKVAQQRLFEKKIIKFVGRSKVIRDGAVELINAANKTIALQTGTTFLDFRDTYREFKHIIDGLERNINFDYSYAKNIYENSKSLHTQYKDIIKTTKDASILVSVLRSIKDNLDKMIYLLNPEIERLSSELDIMRETHQKDKTRIKELEKEIGLLNAKLNKGRSYKEMAENILLKVYPEGIQANKKKSLMKILPLLIENSPRKYSNKDIREKTKLSKGAVSSNCDEMVERDVLKTTKMGNIKNWYYET